MLKKTLTLKDGGKIIFRYLQESDGKRLGIFFENLSESTRKRYGPHPLTKEEARSATSQTDNKNILRMVAVNEKNEVVGYFLLLFSFRYDELVRYRSYGIDLLAGRDLRVAPVIVDAYQNKGLGGQMMKEIIKLAKHLKSKYLILWMGVQANNDRAVHFYLKKGFEKIGEFFKYDTDNYDMYFRL